MRDPVDIGNAATVVGDAGARQGDPPDPADETLAPAALETLAPPASRSLSRVRTHPPRDLPTGLDRSSLTPAEQRLVVSRYVLLSRLGAGGMGLVYLAWDPALDRKVAIKLLRPGDDREPAAEAHARLHREAQALARLSHPNVVAVYDVGTYDARDLYGSEVPGDAGEGVFVVMEYVEGFTLARWLEGPFRRWRDVLPVFLAAGRGLAAAHAVGILHRDFKPGNVLVDHHGGVHVFDFGLARAAGMHDALHTYEPSAEAHTTASVTLNSPLTQIGAVVGTPVYMAPEQRGGEDVDERSDQFSFCVALYEGVFGTRPFSGENFYALEVAKLAGTIDPPKRPVSVPARLRKAIVRGLAAEPSQRWPDLAALLAELESIHRPPRGRRYAAAAAVVVTAGLAAGLHLASGEPVCAGASAALGDAWNPRDAPTLERTFVATGLPYARDTWQRTRERLDRHALAWIAMHTDACEATNVARTQSPERMDGRMQCLARRRAELQALVEVFGRADVEVVDHAVAAVAQLPSIDLCRDPDALPPEFAVETHQIVLADAEQRSGHPQQGRALAEAAFAAAEQAGDRGLQAHAGVVLGSALRELSEFPAAERAFTRAYFDAVAASHDRMALRAAISLISLLGDRMARADDGRAWARHADALLDRLGRPSVSESDYHHNLANLHARTGEYAEAEPLYRRALELTGDSDPIERASILTNLASTIAFLGRAQESIDLYLEVLAVREATLGLDHPLVAQTLTNLGGSYALIGDTDRNEAAQRRALAIWRASLPAGHELLAYPLAALGDIELGRSDYAAALAHFEEARAIWEDRGGADFPAVASMTERLATTRLLQGDIPAARVLADRAVQLWDRSAAPEPIQQVMALIVRSQVAQAERDVAVACADGERARGLLDREFGPDHLYTLAARMQLAALALALAETAHDALARRRDALAVVADIEAILAILERDHGQDARWLVEPLTALARARLAAGRPADARAALERAAPIADAHGLAANRAEIDANLARVAWAEGDRPRARSLAEAAAAVFSRIGARRSLADTEAWLADHPIAP